MFYISNRLREDCHILSATTGRLKDMVEKHRVNLIWVNPWGFYYNLEKVFFSQF